MVLLSWAAAERKPDVSLRIGNADIDIDGPLSVFDMRNSPLTVVCVGLKSVSSMMLSTMLVTYASRQIDISALPVPMSRSSPTVELTALSLGGFVVAVGALTTTLLLSEEHVDTQSPHALGVDLLVAIRIR